MGSQVEALRASLAEMVEAMDRYDADATEPPPQRHVDMIGRARAALSGPRPSEPGRTEADPTETEIVAALASLNAEPQAEAFVAITGGAMSRALQAARRARP
jgi:hypothetical protein